MNLDNVNRMVSLTELRLNNLRGIELASTKFDQLTKLKTLVS